MTAPSPSPRDRAHAAGHPSTMTPQAATRDDRIITGQQMRDAHTWATDHLGYLTAWTCAERVIATVASLISDPEGSYDRADLAAALHEQDTIDVALDLLTKVGAGCID